MRRAVLAGLVLASLAPALPASSHIGLGIKPTFLAPKGFVVVDGSAPVSLRYTSVEAHAEMSHTLSFQADGLPPSSGVAQRLRSGTEIAVVPAEKVAMEVLWDPAAMPSGAWHLTNEYEEFDCILLELAPALVVVRRPGEPPPLGVLVSEPFESSPLVDAAAPLGLRAIGPPGVTVSIAAGDMVPDPELPADATCQELVWQERFPVLVDAGFEPDPEAGEDRWKLDTTWDTSEVPSGAYLLKVTATAPDGSTFVTWARRWINVDHPPVVDVDPDPDPPTTTRDEGCAGGGAGTGAWALGALLAGCCQRRFRRRGP